MSDDGESSTGTTNASSSSSNSNSNTSKLTNSVVQNMIAGGTARIVAATTLHPIDLAKTRMQVRKKKKKKKKKKNKLIFFSFSQFQRKHAMAANATYYRNGLHCIIHTVKTEGFFALYRGLAVRLAYAVPSAAVNFT
jgi:hypothetical protein